MDIHEIQQRLAGEWAFYYDVYYPTAPLWEPSSFSEAAKAAAQSTVLSPDPPPSPPR
ncbi:hypothetical protein [Pseudomonas sp. TE24901]